ncbi:small nuclear ribonucleoprotein sm d1 [Plakobranchus ocellatus]|uniref:Small nuclear ribonucleoprotein sm d1 n=1 Tax=Plakobranchus ocellatus TaxID=259542 RepID=A0AAV4CCH0_9GAST|nr:small nuclear ribonucleoprotein sm d1 [Plakobranchus ocellatus]
MRGAEQILAAAMLLFAHTQTLDTGIDRGNIVCSRETGSELLQAEKGDHGFIVSGGYPDYYSTGGKSGLWCQIHIRVCSTCKVKISFEELSFAECSPDTLKPEAGPRGDWCRPGCDHIHLYEVDSPYDRITHRDYFGGNKSDHYTSISGNMKIRHCVANTSLEDNKLFKLAFTVLDKTELYQGVVFQYGFSGGEITSPNFPNGYALNGETFTYMIQNLDPYGHIRLTFDDWDIHRESKVKVYDGLSENSPHITLDPYKRRSLLSEHNTLVVVLSTGESLEECCFHAGFKAVYEFASGMSDDLLMLSNPRVNTMGYC